MFLKILIQLLLKKQTFYQKYNNNNCIVHFQGQNRQSFSKSKSLKCCLINIAAMEYKLNKSQDFNAGIFIDGGNSFERHPQCAGRNMKGIIAKRPLRIYERLSVFDNVRVFMAAGLKMFSIGLKARKSTRQETRFLGVLIHFCCCDCVNTQSLIAVSWMLDNFPVIRLILCSLD